MPRGKRALNQTPPMGGTDGRNGASEHNGQGPTPWEMQPPGNAEAYGVDTMDQAGKMPDIAAKYIEVHPERPNRLWAETWFDDERDLALNLRLLADSMDDLGQLDIPTLQAAKMAGRIGIKFRGKEMAKEVDIAGSRSSGRFNMMRFMGRGRSSEGPRGW